MADLVAYNRPLRSLRQSRTPSRSRSPSSAPSLSSSSSLSPERSRKRRRNRFSDSEDEPEQGEYLSDKETIQDGEEAPEDSVQNDVVPYRIPKKSEYADAADEVPAPPKRSRLEKRSRVAVPEETKLQLDQWLKGLFLSSSDRLEFLKSLPLVATTLALPPTLDEDLRSILGSKNLFKCTTSVSEKDLLSLHEISASALNLLALVKKMAAEQAELPGNMSAYLDLIGDLLSVAVRDITGWRRELALRALGLKQNDMHSIRMLPLDGSVRLDAKSEEYSPNIFGVSLKKEVLAADSDVKKSIDKLKQRRTSDRQSASRSRRVDRRKDFPTSRNDQRPGIRGNRCLQSELVAPLRLRISTICTNSQGISKSNSRESIPNSDNPAVEGTGLVPSSVPVRTRSAGSPPKVAAPTHGRKKSEPSPKRTKNLLPRRMEHLRAFWKSEGLNSTAANIIMASWAPNTIRQYDSSRFRDQPGPSTSSNPYRRGDGRRPPRGSVASKFGRSK